jgi:hypothetical protein
MNTRVATSVHLASCPCRGSRFGFDSRCDRERTIRVKYNGKLINITAGHKACRRMAQCCIGQSNYNPSQPHSWFTTPSTTFEDQPGCWVNARHLQITFRAIHTGNIIIVGFLHRSISATIITAVFIGRHHAPIRAQVWQPEPRNCQPPHLVHLSMLLSGICRASAIFLTPTQPQLMHW